MPTKQIIDSIDEYLSRLRQARQLLLAERTTPPKKIGPLEKSNFAKPWLSPAASTGRPTVRTQSRSKTSTHNADSKNRLDHANREPHKGSIAGQAMAPMAIEPEFLTRRSTVAKASRPKRRIVPTGLSRSRTTAPSSGGNLGKIKPAIALGSGMSGKFVVVSAEQVRRELEQVSRPSGLQPRLTAAGQSGRSAFEALFKDDNPL